MSRPLRIEYDAAWYPVMNRGLDRRCIFRNAQHRELFLELPHEIHAYCLMGNHYHLLLRTPIENLARTMRHLNGIYTPGANG